jgi:hypothetical protein
MTELTINPMITPVEREMTTKNQSHALFKRCIHKAYFCQIENEK